MTTAGGELYVTSFQGQQIYTVAADGTPDLLAGTGRFGEVDGPAAEARFSWPNGLASGPPGDRLYTNDYLNRQRPGVAQRPVPLSSLRMIKLPSVAERMVAALGTGGLAAMEAAYREFKEDPSNGSTNTEFLLNGLGYQLMNGDNLTAAIRVFELNVGSYPSSANVYDSLAEGYMNAGRNDEAIEFYEKSLAINPGNTNATDMIARIRSGD
ncbi:MAG: tetratricopeptide repeat protein [Gemmatimonadota bacterium]